MFVRTNTLIDALEARLKSLPLAEGNEVADGPLFQRVGAFGANKLLEAMKSVFASEQRVTFIVPGGDQHPGARDRNLVSLTRTSRIALLIADRDLGDKTGALVGSEHALGILYLKDRVIENFLTVPFTGPDLAFVPTDGEPLVITDAEKPGGNLGRECWLQWFSCYAGEARMAIP